MALRAAFRRPGASSDAERRPAAKLAGCAGTAPAPRPKRYRPWVSKTDLTDWLRCEYAYWLVYSGQASRSELISDAVQPFVDRGVAFEQSIQAPLPRVRVDSFAAWAAANPTATLHQPPMLRNFGLQFYGRPDFVDVAAGAMYPGEIKGHAKVTSTDRLELAFYWLLLEPYRTRDVPPEGTMVLRRDGGAELVWVAIGQRELDRVAEVAGQARAARRTGVRPRKCSCGVCGGARRREIEAELNSAKDLSMVFGIGRPYAEALERTCAITSWDQLVEADCTETALNIGSEIAGVTPGRVWSWKLHASALAAGKPALAQPCDPFPLGAEYIALDLEYEPETAFVWLAGIAVVKDGACLHEQRLVMNATDEADALRWLRDAIAIRPNLPIVTWSGRSADLPTLRKAAERLSVDIAEIERRHVDLYYDWYLSNVRLPISSAGLKEMAAHLSVDRVSPISSGLEALAFYRQAMDTGSQALREQLLAYNRDDVESLVAVVERLRVVPDSRHEVVLVRRPADAVVDVDVIESFADAQ